jgi:hypothetical protein
MVAPVENLTRLEGTVKARRAHPGLDGWDLVTLAVERAEPVSGQADLLSRHAGSELELAVPRALLGAAGPGAQLSTRAKFTPDGARAEAHPDPGAFSVRGPAD